MRSASLNVIMHAESGQPKAVLGACDEPEMEGAMAEYLLFATERYALPILQPLAEALQAAGHGVSAWFVDGAAGARLPAPVRMVGLREAVALQPRAVFSAANWVPTFVSGAKVQLFHGFNVEKREDARGHFRVRGLFDLYCTQGPATTAPFAALAARDGSLRRRRNRLAQARPAVRRPRRLRQRRCARLPAGGPWCCSARPSPSASARRRTCTERSPPKSRAAIATGC